MVKADIQSQTTEQKESIYNLILMDLNMPEMDGNTCMTEIREYLYKNNLK
jgi:CheY-like chemotaxis protein